MAGHYASVSNHPPATKQAPEDDSITVKSGDFLHVRSGEATLAPYAASVEETNDLVESAVAGDFFDFDFGDAVDASS